MAIRSLASRATLASSGDAASGAIEASADDVQPEPEARERDR